MARTVFQQDHGLSAYRWVVAEAGKYRHAQPGESPEGFVVSVGGPSRFVVETAGEVKLPPGVLAAGTAYTVGTNGALVASSSGGYGEATGATAMKLTPTVSAASSGSGSTTIVTVPDRFPNFYTDVSIGTLTLDNAYAGPVYYHIPMSGTAPTLEGSQIWTGTNDFTTTVRVVGGPAIDGTAAPAFSDQTTLSGGTVEAGTDVSTGGVLRVHGTTDVISMGSGAYGAPIVIYYDPAVQTHGSALSWSYGGYQIGEIGYDTTVVGGTPVFRITTEANQPSGAPSKDIEVCPGSIRQIVSRNSSISMLGPVYVGSASTIPSRTLDVGGTFRASGNSTLGGTLGVTGATTLSDTLGVSGLATLSAGASITGNVNAYNLVTTGLSSDSALGLWSWGRARFSGTTVSTDPSVYMNGVWYAGAMPHVVIGTTTSSIWSAAGTGFGVNAPSSGFTGNLIDLQRNGTRIASVSPALATINVPLQLANATADPGTEGSVFWDPNDHTLAIRPDVLGSTLQVGQEMWVRVVNKTGSLIPDGTAVYVNGAQGNRPTVTAAIATSSNADRTIGVVTSDIANNAEGLVTIIGTVHGYNTSSFTTGDVLYLSGTTAGALTNIRPTAPTHATRVGYALNSTNNGSILVSLHLDSGLAELHDTVITSPSSDQFLRYNGTTWVNTTVAIPTDLDSLTDVAISSPTTAQLLRYNGTTWQNATVALTTDLDSLTDVTLTSPTSGQALIYDGSVWRNAAAGSTTALASLTDVTITSPTTDQLLRYNGTKWVNTTPSFAPLASPTFTGTPAGPTASAGTNTTQLATTAFVATALDQIPALSVINRVINGAMEVDQRNAGASHTITSTPTVTVDRWWVVSTGANTTAQRLTSIQPGRIFDYTIYGAASVTGIGIYQDIEAQNIADLAGGNATLSVTLANTLLTTATWTIYRPSPGADDFSSVTSIATGTFTGISSTPSRFTASFSLPTLASWGIRVRLDFGAQTSGGLTIGAVQLQAGSVASPFSPRPVGAELALCQRYYQKFNLSNNWRAWGQFYTTTNGRVWLPYYTPMRVVPTLSTTGVAGDAIGNGATTFTSIGNQVIGIDMASFDLLGATVARSQFQPLVYTGVAAMDAEL